MAQTMKRRTAEQWASLVAGWRQSGLTASEYGRRHGLSPKTLGWWASELKRREGQGRGLKQGGRKTVERRAEFVPLKVAEPSPRRGGLSVTHDSGFTVVIEGEVDAGALAAVLSAVRSC